MDRNSHQRMNVLVMRKSWMVQGRSALSVMVRVVLMENTFLNVSIGMVQWVDTDLSPNVTSVTVKVILTR